MKTSQIFGELYKSHTIAGIIEELAVRCPDQLYGAIPADESNPEAGWKDISIGTFAQMIDKAAWWLTEALGRGMNDFEPIHFFLPGDLAILVLVIASWKAGYKGVFCHPLATAEIHSTINKAMNCKILAFSGELPENAKALYASNPDMRLLAVPPLSCWIGGHSVPPYDYPKTLDEARDTPMAVVHSSGTTGPPKAVTFTQGSYMSMVSSLICCDALDRLNYAAFRGHRVATLVPLSIGAGFFHNIGANFCFDYTIVHRRASEPLSVKSLDAMMLQAEISAIITAPPVLLDLLAEPEPLQRFRENIHAVIYVGAPLPRHAGDVLANYTLLSGTYGSTETGVYPIYLNPPEDWSYYEYDPVFQNALQAVGQIGYHEVVIPRSSDPWGPFQSVFTLFPNEQEWKTKDVFLQHADAKKKNLWHYVGRTDDFISDSGHSAVDALDTAASEPFLPNEMEAIITSSELVSGIVICENRSGKLAAVIEPHLEAGEQWQSAKEDEFMQSISAKIKAANEACPIPGGIERDLVVIASEPLSKGTKGYPHRARTQEQYAAAIDEAYVSRSNKKQDGNSGAV